MITKQEVRDNIKNKYLGTLTLFRVVYDESAKIEPQLFAAPDIAVALEAACWLYELRHHEWLNLADIKEHETAIAAIDLIECADDQGDGVHVHVRRDTKL